ncbi:MAG TPA: glycosyltransferase [Pyrinomonadaceae bacterium]|nr:glycosyltransferase [Pyrinomonadaceae bacterium]
MLRDASIVCLSSIDWTFNRQIPQEVALALAAGGSRVLFVENTGVRRAVLRDAARLWARLRHWLQARGGAWHTAEGVDVLSPLLLPFPYSPSATSTNVRLLVRAIRAWLGDGGGPLIVITFLPTPLTRAVIAALRPALVVYYCLDRLEESSPGARRVAQSERLLFAEADLVLVTSGLLYKSAAGASSRVELLASGVHIKQFEKALDARAAPLAALAGIPRPVIGYVGSIRSATDLSLVARAAELAPDLQFVLAGPRFVDVAQLAARPNVRILDRIPHEHIARYMVRFDVGILPYSIDEFTAGIMPVKLKEYLAAGLPVVATALPEVVRFADEHPGLVRFAGDPAGFVAALREALSDKAPEALAHRTMVARQFDWGDQMARMKQLIEQALARTCSG